MQNNYEQVDVIPPGCPSCGSTERTAYHNVRTMEIRGVTQNGFAYERIEWKRTSCKDCGQHRVDRVFHNSKPKARRKTKSVKRTSKASE